MALKREHTAAGMWPPYRGLLAWRSAVIWIARSVQLTRMPGSSAPCTPSLALQEESSLGGRGSPGAAVLQPLLPGRPASMLPLWRASILLLRLPSESMFAAAQVVDAPSLASTP